MSVDLQKKRDKAAAKLALLDAELAAQDAADRVAAARKALREVSPPTPAQIAAGKNAAAAAAKARAEKKAEKERKSSF